MTLKKLWDVFKSRHPEVTTTEALEYNYQNAFYAGADALFQFISHASTKTSKREVESIMDGFNREIQERAALIATRGKEN